MQAYACGRFERPVTATPEVWITSNEDMLPPAWFGVGVCGSWVAGREWGNPSHIHVAMNCESG